jgi:demethylspheroidene O-methyltransferase
MGGFSLRLSGSSFAERLWGWRRRLAANRGFQQWAARSPLTRWLARRRARALFDLCAGFVYSQILSACVKLKVFETLLPGPLTCESIALQTGLDSSAALRLLKAAASLRLLEALPDGRFALDDLGASMIGNPEVGAFVVHHDLLYADLADPVALLRGRKATQLARFWTYSGNSPTTQEEARGPDGTVAYSDLMSRTQGLVAETIVDAYPFARHRRLLDVGGGEGAFLTALARRAPGLDLMLFDLPPVAERARTRFAALGLAERVAVVGGDILGDRLPQGADVATLVRVLHDHDDESARAILASLRDALPQNGTLVVAEPMAGERGAEPMGDAYFGFYLLAMGSGRPRTYRETADLLKQSGFGRTRRLWTPNPLTISALAATRL